MAYHSRNTEAVATDTIVPNLLNLDYVVKVDESGHKKAQLRNNCQLYRMFARNGYQVNLINHVDYLGSAGCRVLTSHQTRRTISEYLMRNSLYHKFPPLRELLEQFFVFDYGANYRASLDNALEAGLNCWQETGGTPTLTVGYIQWSPRPYHGGPAWGGAALLPGLELAGPQSVPGSTEIHERLHPGSGRHHSGK